MDSFLLYIFLTAMVLSLIIVFIKRGYTRANLFLGGYFFFCSFTNLVVNFGLYGDSPFWTALLGTNLWPVIFLIGPFAFFYVRSILTDDPKIKGYDYFHFTLFLLQLAGMIPYYLSSWEYKKTVAGIIHTEAWNLTSIPLSVVPTSINLVLMFLHFVIYMVLILSMLWRYKRASGIKAYYNLSLRFTERWLIIFCIAVGLFFISGMYLITCHLLYPTRDEFLSNSRIIISSYGLIVVLLILGLLSFPEIMYGLPRIRALPRQESSKPGNKDEVFLNEEVIVSKKDISLEETLQFTGIDRKLKEVIMKSSPYLDLNFSIYKLASEIEVPIHHLRYYFNRHGLSFTVYKNRLRVTHAKMLLRAGDYNKFNIEGIGRLSGFSSNTSFFTEFRKEAGMSPMEYARLKQIEM